MFIFPVDFYLFEDLEIRFKSPSWTNMTDAVHDLCAVATWLLLSKTIAGKSQHHEVGVILLKRINLVVLIGVTSVSGYVHNQDNLSLVVLQ